MKDITLKQYVSRIEAASAWAEGYLAENPIRPNKAKAQALAPVQTVSPIQNKFMNISLVASDPKNVLEELQRSLNSPQLSYKENAARAFHFGRLWSENRERLTPVLDETANNIDAALKLNAVLQETVGAFAIRLKVLRAFSTVFQNVPLQGTDAIEVPYYPLQAVASTDWNADNGYVFGQATNTQKAEITVNKRKYQPLDYSSSTFRRQPFFKLVELVQRNVAKLGVDILTDIWSVITAANFGGAAATVGEAAWTSDDVVNLRGVANAANWPDVGRSLIVNDVVDTALSKDESYKLALNIGTTSVIQQGKLPNLSGFDYSWIPNMPANGESLIGVIAFMSCIGAAFCPVEPTPEVRAQLAAYNIVTDTQTGISMNYRAWGLAQSDRSFHIVESAYGYNVLVAAALKRLCKP